MPGGLCDAAKPVLVQAGMPSLSSRINVSSLVAQGKLHCARGRSSAVHHSVRRKPTQCIACCSPRDWLQRGPSHPCSAMAARLPVLFEDIAIAATRIRGGVVRPGHALALAQPALRLRRLPEARQFQFTGSLRSAARQCLDVPARKEAKASSRLRGQPRQLSWHGKQLGIPVSVLMPTVAPREALEVREVRR